MHILLVFWLTRLRRSETEIIVYAPAGQPNSTVQIVVQNSDGQRASRNFVYLDIPPPEPGAPEISFFDPNVSYCLRRKPNHHLWRGL